MTRQDYFSKVGVFIKPSSREPDAGLEGANQEGPQGDPGGRGHRSPAETLKQRRREGNGGDAVRKVCVLIPDPVPVVEQNTPWSLRF